MTDTAPPFRIGLVKLPVENFSRAVTFWRDVVGLPAEFAVEEFGWAQFTTGSLPLCLYQVGKGGGDGTPGNGGEANFHLETDDATAAHARIASAGGTVEELHKSPDGSTFFMLVDPEGNRVKVMQRG